MFGIIRPCRHRLSEALRASWWAHLCGLCYALRNEHGQLARVATNYDGLIISVLVDAQASAKVRDHVDDGDGAFGRQPVAGTARLVASRWARQGGSSGTARGRAGPAADPAVTAVTAAIAAPDLGESEIVGGPA